MGLSQNLQCIEDDNGSNCTKCHFRRTMDDVEYRIMNLERSFTSMVRKSIEIETAEGVFDDACDIINDKKYKVTFSKSYEVHGR